MKTPNLNKRNIETFDIGIIRNDIEKKRLFMVYAPLSDVLFLSDAENIKKIEEGICQINQDADPQLNNLINILLDNSASNIQDRIVSSPSKFTKLSILPNLKCNFSCSYCYSAKGRANTEISSSDIKKILDYFIDRNRIETKDLTIFISGGGEPLLSWEKVKQIVEYGQNRADIHGFQLNILLMTNGSLFTDDIANFLKKNQVGIGISFEILHDIQQSQRKMYDTVRSNIKNLLEQGISPSISSVITPLNVERMEEMANIIISDYDGIRHLNFDPAMSNEIFSNSEQLDIFYNKFEQHFFNAKNLCGHHHITLDCNAIRHVEKIFPRYCQGKLCVVPNGDISICHTLSSPNEAMYNDAIYGNISADGIMFDHNKFHNLISEGGNLLPECSSCIARWHCAGGCLMYRRNYNAAKMESVCRFTQRITAKVLLSKLNMAYKEKHSEDIDKILSNYKK